MTATTDTHGVVRALHPRLAFVFDFDRTLAERTTDHLLRHLGVDPDTFTHNEVRPRVDDGWEERFAEAHALVELSRGEHGPITREVFAEVARSLELYPGVPELFDRLTAAVHDVDDALDVEFHLITAGFVEVPQATPIAHHFTSIIGGAWAFDESGAICWPKRTVGHYDKVRHLLAIAKGLDSVAADRPDDIDRDVPEEDWHVPFEQMIFAGDGDSDLPSFDFMQSHAGTAIAVHQASDATEWEARDDMRRGRQVAAVVPSDFRPGTPALQALETAARRAALWPRLLRTHPEH